MSFFSSKTKDSSLLGQQALSKNKRKKNLFLLKIFPLILLALFLYNYKPENFSKNLLPKFSRSSLSLELKQLEHRPQKEQKKIISKIKKIVQNKTVELPLNKTLEKLQKTDFFSKISLQYYPDKKLLIKAEIKTPYLKIKVDNTIRYLTENGLVFGKANKKDKNLLLIEGIFPKNFSFKYDKFSSLIIPAKYKQLILEAIEVYQQAKQNKTLVLNKLSYKEHRGFLLKIKSQRNFDVILGFKPFTSKFKKLNAILNSLQLENKTPQIIELDYQGKAFVKVYSDKKPA